MDLEYNMKGALKSSKPQVVRVEFDPPLLGYEEVKPRLLGMKVDADEALGTVRPNPYSLPCPCLTGFLTCTQIKSPQIMHFEIPFEIWTTGSLLLLLIYTSSAPPDSDANHWWLARTLCPGIFPSWIIPLSWMIAVIGHGGEAAYATFLAYRHHMPWHIAVSPTIHRLPRVAAVPNIVPQTAWVGAVTIFGFPVLMRLRRLIKQARIDSIMKGN